MSSNGQSKQRAIINELSWGTRLKIMKEYQKGVPKTRRVGISLLTEGVYTTMSSTSQSQSPIINELPWGTRLKTMREFKKGVPQTRRVGISLLTEGQDDPKAQEDTAAKDPNSEDTSMKIKLFRLMFETIKDSDLKVRRAELVKAQYGNYSTFEIGFLIGDITDKLNVVTDISLTLKKMYAEWKPMEHINAYEQIANKAIEISHLIDVVKIVHKKITNKHEKESVEGQ